MLQRWIGASALALLGVPTPCLAGSPDSGEPAPLDDAPTDRVAAPSQACSASGRWCARVDGSWVQVVGPDGERRLAVAGADRLAVRDDGWVAFVAPLEGWPSVHVCPRGGEVVPITNLALVRSPGRAPEGFQAPPVREGDLRFADGALTWTLPGGEVVSVALPGEAP